VAPTICMPEDNSPPYHSQRHRPTRPGNPGRLHEKRLATLLAARQPPLAKRCCTVWRNSARTRPVGLSAIPRSLQTITGPEKHMRADRANVVSEGIPAGFTTSPSGPVTRHPYPLSWHIYSKNASSCSGRVLVDAAQESFYCYDWPDCGLGESRSIHITAKPAPD
jgi:hypothetical protein